MHIYISEDVEWHLKNNGIKDLEMIKGSFTTDNLNIVDYKDLDVGQNDLLMKEYGNRSNASIQDFLNKHYTKEFIETFKLYPHWFLTYKGLILDDSTPMFKKAMEGPITKKNYGFEPPHYPDEEDYRLENDLNESANGLGKIVIKAIIFQTDEEPKKDLQLFKGFDRDGIYNLDENTFIAFEKRYKDHPEGWNLIHQDIKDRWIEKYFPKTNNSIARCKDFYLEIDNGVGENSLYYDINEMKHSPTFKYYVDDIKNAVDDYFEV